MTLSPDRSLQHWLLGWFALSVASVPLLMLRPLVPVAGITLLAAVLADSWLAWREGALSLAREVPEKASRDQEVEVVLRVENPLTRPVEIELCESVPRDLVFPEPVWRDLRVEAGGVARLLYPIRPRVRGRRSFGEATALVRSPLGLLRRRVGLDSGQSILIHPETERFLRPEAIDPKRVLAALGVRPRRRRGDGLDFESLREYVAGDEPRRIDWRATARRGRPIVRTQRHEESRTVILAVDCSRLMGTRAPLGGTPSSREPALRAAEGAQAGFAATKLDHAVDATLALAFASLAAGDRVGLVLFDRGLRKMIAPLAGRARLGLFVDALSGIQPAPYEADYRRMTRELLARQRKRAMLIVLTDFIELDSEELIDPLSLLARHHEVVLVTLREPILEALDDAPPSAASPFRSKLAASTSPMHAIGSSKIDALAIYRRIVLADLLHEREERLVSLRRRGLSVIDVPPADATAATLNRFLELRYGVG